MSSEVKKLVSVLVTTTPVTGTREKTDETAEVGKNNNKSEGECPNLAQVPCIRYPIAFRKKSVPVSALLDSGSKVNAIHPIFAWELRLPIGTTDVGAQKIDGTMLNIFGMVVVAFLVTDKTNPVTFFEKTLLVANVSPKVVFGMLFLTLSGTDVDFLGWELW